MPQQYLLTAFEDNTFDIETSRMDVAHSYDEAVQMKEELHEDGYRFVEIEKI